MPITWRNVNNTVSGGGGGRDYRGAQDSFDSGFGALQKVLDRRQATNNDNFATGQQNTVADYLDKVAQAETMEDVGDLRGNSQLDALRQQLTGASRGQVRGAIDDRESGLIEQIGQRDQFGDDQHNRELRPEVQQALAQARAGGPGSEQAVAMLAELDYRDDGEMLTNVADAADKGLARDHSKATDSRANQATAMAWNSDTRAGEVHDRQGDIHDYGQVIRGRELDGLEQGDRMDGLVSNMLTRMDGSDTDMTATEIERRFITEAMNDGFSAEEAQAGADRLSSGRMRRFDQAGEDALHIEQAVGEIEQGLANNTIYRNGGYSEAPQQDANNMLDKFADDEGRWFGIKSANTLSKLGAEAEQILGEGTQVGVFGGGASYRIPPGMLEAAIQGIPKASWWRSGNSINAAVRKHVKAHPDLEAEIKEYNEGLEQMEQVRQAGAQATAPTGGNTGLSVSRQILE